MSALASQVEISKLARELGAGATDIDFLDTAPAEELRALRATISQALFARHEARFRRVAVLSTLLPVPITAKIAQLALGPELCARIASVMDPDDAAHLATQLDPDFLAELAPALDPARVAPIVARLPATLVIDVGNRLLAVKEHLVLGRFVAVVAPDTALGVIRDASATDLLQVALFTEEPAALETIVVRLDATTLVKVIQASADQGRHVDALTLVGALSVTSRSRLIGELGLLDERVIEGFVDAMTEHDAWAEILPALPSVDPEPLRRLVRVVAKRGITLIDVALRRAREHDLAPALVRMVLVLEPEHVDLLTTSQELQDPDVQEWLVRTGGVAPRLVRAVFNDLFLNA